MLSLITAGIVFYNIETVKVQIGDKPVRTWNNLIVSTKQGDYINIEKAMKLQNNKCAYDKYGFLALISGSRIIRISAKKNYMVINGDTEKLTQGDIITKDNKIYVSSSIYRHLTDQVAFKGKNGTNYLYTTGGFRIPENMTFGEYADLSQSKRIQAVHEKDYTPKIIALVRPKQSNNSTDDVNPIIDKVYGSMCIIFDNYYQFELYDWANAMSDSGGIIGDAMCCNANAFFGAYKDLSQMQQINKLKSYSLKDIEYINRIYTMYNCIDFSKLKALAEAIKKYETNCETKANASTDKNMQSILNVYADSAKDVYNVYEESIDKPQINRLEFPMWVSKKQDFIKTINEEKYKKAEEQAAKAETQLDKLKNVKEKLDDTKEEIQKYSKLVKIILSKYMGTFGDKAEKFGETTAESLDPVFQVIESDNDDLQGKELEKDINDKLKDYKISDMYDWYCVLKDYKALLQNEENADASIKEMQKELDENNDITKKIIDNEVNSSEIGMEGLESGNLGLTTMGGGLLIETLAAEKVTGAIEKVGLFNNTMIFLSFDTDNIDEVFNGTMSLNKYLSDIGNE